MKESYLEEIVAAYLKKMGLNLLENINSIQSKNGGLTLQFQIEKSGLKFRAVHGQKAVIAQEKAIQRTA